MQVTDYTWLGCMLVLPVAYWITPKQFRWLTIVGLTEIILGWYSPVAAILLPFYAVVCWLANDLKRHGGIVILSASIILLAPFFYFKWQAKFDIANMGESLVPLGISYFVLRSIHYLIESYKGTFQQHTFLDVVRYLIFLPTIIAGPIHRFPPFLRDYQRNRFNEAFISEGLERILYGYVKIYFLANYLVNFQLRQYAESFESTSPKLSAYLLMLSQGLNGYLQFSGYSDIAIGFALLLGYRVMENFNWPFAARNIQEFWAAWHISLTSWCREYIYSVIFSFTRSRVSGIIASMVVLGLWHELSLRYLAWGVYNGLGIVAWHQWQKVKLSLPVWTRPEGRFFSVFFHVVSVLLTFHFVILGFVLVNNNDLAGALEFYGKLLLF